MPITAPDARKLRLLISLVLWAVALHSLLVGIGLIVQSPAVITMLGFSAVGERFFPAQGGMFHIVITAVYVLAALNPDRFRCLVWFSIYVKGLAMVFLLAYYFTVDSLPIVLLSGIGDGMMMAVILFCLAAYCKRLGQESVPAA